METLKKIVLFIAVAFSGSEAYGQSDSLGLPGDNLDLQAVLSIFKNSSSVEEFEKNLNSASEKINNLDLNGDGQVDYLRVIESGKEDFRSIVIQAPVSKTESQDVAVIEIEKRGEKTAHIQIVGDETLYGKDYIIEPRDQSTAKKSAASGDDAYANSTEKGERTERRSNDSYDDNSSGGSSNVTVVNVWGWPAVGYMYAPGYSFWVSPWYWGYYPGWYSPWAPYGYYYYHRAWIGYNYGFYGYRTHYYRFPHVHHYYYGRRVSSGYVQKTAPSYHRRQANMANPNRTHYNRAANRPGERVSDGGRREQHAKPSNQPGSQRVRDGENRITKTSPSGGTRINRGGDKEKVNRGGTGNRRVESAPSNRPSGTMQRGGNPGGSNRGGGTPGGGGGGNRGGGGGGHQGGGGGHRR